MAKFYDSNEFPLLCEELAARNFPRHLLVLGFRVHAAPRILKVGKCFGPPVHSCNNSIVVGCQLSTSFARGMLYKLMEQLSKVDPEYPCVEHVDDLSHLIVAETEWELNANLPHAGRFVGR